MDGRRQFWRPAKDAQDQSVYVRMARLSAIITILPASMAGGWVLGYFGIDRFLGTFPWGSVIVTLIAAGGGFYEVIKILIPDQRSAGGPSENEKS